MTGDGSDFDIGAFEHNGYGLQIRESLLGIVELTNNQRLIFDLNHDNSIDTSDLVREIFERN